MGAHIHILIGPQPGNAHQRLVLVHHRVRGLGCRRRGTPRPRAQRAYSRGGRDLYRDYDALPAVGEPIRLLVTPVPGWRTVRLDRIAGTAWLPPGWC